MTYIHTQPWAVYNEIEDYAASWLENLIAAGHIANGIVDRRSIIDVRPDDYRGFRQVHLFAGIGVWSYAFRRAGVSDDTALWSLSCPCQPFSAAGKGAGVDDERHLWPHAHHLIRERRPAKIYGEQVASKDGLAWLDLVSVDLEGTGYAFGAVDTCSASVGAPHIRQRLRFHAYDLQSSNERLADTDDKRFQWQHSPVWREQVGNVEAVRSSETSVSSGYIDRSVRGVCGQSVGMDDDEGLEGFGRRHQTSIRHGKGSVRPASETSELGGLADANGGKQRETGTLQSGWKLGLQQEDGSALRQGNCGSRSSVERLGDGFACPTNGFWRDVDWLFCRDGQWRPVEPSTFPLAHGAPSRVGRLRAYGNAVDAEATREFIEATLEHETLDLEPVGSDFDDVLG